MMESVADKTDVNLEKSAEVGKSSDSIHMALMAAGMTPGIGNVADLTDATLYALEGELGNAAWSAAAAIPIIGQMVSGRRAVKAAKEAGEEMVTFYRGVDNWYPGRMKEVTSKGIKEGKEVGLFPKGLPKEFLVKVHDSKPKKKYDLFRKNFRRMK